jgi:hypothetical protein
MGIDQVGYLDAGSIWIFCRNLPFSLFLFLLSEMIGAQRLRVYEIFGPVQGQDQCPMSKQVEDHYVRSLRLTI